ncbi:D-hexose-6-phosphate mutarotase [Halopseudomonas salegens]|uniref:Putative glucose-6-phosphate 1-epimerase n=1 Tax=Halopseudomonas salegens TaxID=1434072 RepID=A0A1H2FEC6_9GAMM|nr:D-hexose-6-phosphate mutarotase [Halopseudomonas salegens]SDU05711.1 glucose-6-phosphate 1-epimerase [Halopseudomonas salegens]
MTNWQYTHMIRLGELDAVEVRHPAFIARVCLQGAHLVHFAPTGQDNWLWLSEQVQFLPGRSIRGGVPICWPWFGVPEKNPPAVRDQLRTDAAHGFARTALWSLAGVAESADAVSVRLALSAADLQAPQWSGEARAELLLTFTAVSCSLELVTTNLGASPLHITQALHTYLPTPDIHNTRVHGLAGCRYIDTLQEWQEFEQRGPVRFSGETDRIYYSNPQQPLGIYHAETCAVQLEASGSHSTVVWNPGPEKAQRLSDFLPAAWTRMLCVETANALDDAQSLEPGDSAHLSLMMRTAN